MAVERYRRTRWSLRPRSRRVIDAPLQRHELLRPHVTAGPRRINARRSCGSALHRARIVGSFAFAQAAVQVIGFLSGILLVRYLDQRDYAFFTIANTMQGTINVLADIGISIGLVSIGGRVWQDRQRFGELITHRAASAPQARASS